MNSLLESGRRCGRRGGAAWRPIGRRPASSSLPTAARAAGHAVLRSSRVAAHTSRRRGVAHYDQRSSPTAHTPHEAHPTYDPRGGGTTGRKADRTTGRIRVELFRLVRNDYSSTSTIRSRRRVDETR